MKHDFYFLQKGGLCRIILLCGMVCLPIILHADICSPAPSGLVAWWSAENNALDNTGTSSGVLEGEIGFSSGKVGQAFHFNNADADVPISPNSTLNVGVGSGFTLVAWINPTNTAVRSPLFEWNVGDGTTYWGIHFYIDPVSFGAGSGALYANVVDSHGNWHQIHSSGGVVTNNAFQHVALTYDKATGVATIYRNGMAMVQRNLGGFTPLTTYALYLGRRPLTQGEAYSFAGLMDEACIYNRALSLSEIAAIYDASSTGKSNADNANELISTDKLTASYINSMVTVNPYPTLSIFNSGTNVLLSWPTWAADFKLQGADIFAPMTVWSNLAITLQTNGDNVMVTLPVSAPSKFFRLSHP